MKEPEPNELFTILELGDVTKRQILDPFRPRVPSVVFVGQHKESGAIGVGVFWGIPDAKLDYDLYQNCLFDQVSRGPLMLRVIRSYRAMVLAGASTFLDERIITLYTRLVSGESPSEAWEKRYISGFCKALSKDGGLRYTYEDIFTIMPRKLEVYMEQIERPPT